MFGDTQHLAYSPKRRFKFFSFQVLVILKV